MNTRNTLVAVLSIIVAVQAFLNVAAAQNALGSGNALDRNLGVGTGGKNQASAKENYRDRNLVITGDVAGGRGFRGTVGYTAPSDFRGRLGSNELFAFRADSAYSSPDLIRLGNTFEQLRYGQDSGAIIGYRRSGSGAAAAIDVQNPVSVNTGVNVATTDRRIDRSTLALSTQSAVDQSVEPRIIGMSHSGDNQTLLLNASTIRGLTIERLDQSVGLIGLSTLDAARVRKDIEAGTTPQHQLGTPFEARFEASQGDDAKIDSTVKPGRVTAGLEPDYDKILHSIAERYAHQENVNLQLAPDLLEKLNKDYKDLREKLTGQITSTTDPLAAGGGGTQSEQTSRPPSERTNRNPSALPVAPSSADTNRPVRQGEKPDTDVKPSPPTADMPRTGEAADSHKPDLTKKPPSAMEQYGSMLRHGERVEKLSGPDQSRFNELIAGAEQRLREGDYFWAERRFERALRFTPGHPMATIGVAHAQLGAGLYLSASFTLRNLLINSPEMIDTTYAPELLPPRDRLDVAIARIKELIAGEKERVSYAFLLSYVGHQTADRKLVEQGLKVMGELEPDNTLLVLLKSVWLGDKDQPQTPKPAAAPASTPKPADPGK